MTIGEYDILPFSFVYAYPEAFWLMTIIPLLTVLFILRERKGLHRINYSSYSHFNESVFDYFLSKMRYLLFAFKMIALASIITALARPQAPRDAESFKKKYTEGIDIVIALDVSGSMLARDLKPDRLEASKQIAIEFIEGRPNDRIGLVVFEGESFTISPITTDHSLLKKKFLDVTTGMVEGGTAIGMGLATAVNRLRESDAKSKVVILLSDGVSNRGEVDPITAGQIAEEYGIRVYTIGVATNSPTAPFPVQTPFGMRIQEMPVEVDEETLKEISAMTDGKYYRAIDNESMRNIYKEIDQLEKTRVNVVEYKQKPPEKFHGFLALALLLLIPTFIIERIWLKSVAS